MHEQQRAATSWGPGAGKAQQERRDQMRPEQAAAGKEKNQMEVAMIEIYGDGCKVVADIRGKVEQAKKWPRAKLQSPRNADRQKEHWGDARESFGPMSPGVRAPRFGHPRVATEDR